MKRILFIDHEMHRTTGSFRFLERLLRERYEVETYYYARHGHCHPPQKLVEAADWIVFLEFLPWRYRMGVPRKKCLFVPMYDNEWGSRWQWTRIARSRMHVLSFCERVTKHARACGVRNVLDVRYAPDPARFCEMRGDPRKLLLWERGSVTFETVKALFAPEALDEVLVLRHPEEALAHTAISADDAARYHVRVVETGFLPEAEYKALLRGPGLVLAPRLKEGIGMAFLEAMAMGKVVIAHNDATMDEAIQEGVNGVLVDMRHPTRLDAETLRRLHAKGFSMETQYARWQDDAQRLLAYLQAPERETFRPVRNPFLFALYVGEGFSFRLRTTHR